MARYALVVGISEYKSKHLANLSKPVGDAEAIAELLKTYGGCEQVKVLKGYVSAEQLETALTTLITEQAIRNEVVIYFTGHGFATQGLGGKKGHLATSDCEIEVEASQPKRQSKAIVFSDLNDLIRASNLSNLVMFLDACHSGEFIESTLVEQSFSAFSTQQDYWLIAACRGFEEAWAKKSEEHSVFTGALLEALSSKNADPDGCITGDLLVEYLRRALKGSRQELVRYGKGRSLPIVRFSLPERPHQSSPTKASDTADRVVRSSLVPLQMPPLPDHFVERPEQQRRVKEDLLCEGTKSGTLVVSAIYGLGGIGKSVLATKLARDPDVQSHFSDGILWATLGQNPDILPLLSGWIQALGDNDYKPTATESASNHLRTLLYDKRILLVVDDVWNPEHLEPFRVGGEGSCALVTTREARISGAHRHELSVMSPEQSLELMTQKLSEPLSDIARQQALSFAERVGHLPLALELAASQIEDGVTWLELVEDFQSEIVRLETLDVYGQTEMPDEEKRRKYSLLACFNLSLKQLSLEQLRQFAWLGAVPEDVSLTQEMAETLWQVTRRQAGLILRIFRSKSLVLQGAKQADERPSYRMHDLMHDLAQQLLTSSPQPSSEGELPGLGLTKAEAHSQLLERYRKKTHKGQWHTLKDDGYIYAYLTWHMEQAKQPEAIHQLLQASNEEGRNGWYEACDAIGKPAGFVNDMGRAWTQAVGDYEQFPSRTLTRLFRYALMRASLNSLASNVPAQLVEALVEKGIWQPAQGLAYAQQAQDPWQRAECIAAIAFYMPKALLPEALKTVGQIKDAVYRSYVLSKLAEQFPEMWPEVLSVIRQIQDRYGRHRQQTKGFSYRGLALRRIMQYLPSQYLGYALDIARQIQEVSDRVMVLIALAKYFPELWPEALSMTRTIKDESSRSSALIELANHLPELWPEALSMTRKIKDEYLRSSALRALAKHLPTELWPEALSMTREIEGESARSHALRALAKHLPAELLPEALSMTREIEDESARSRALRALAKHLPAELLPEVLNMAREIEDKSPRSYALIALAKYFPELWSEALSVTREIEHKFSRSCVLVELANHLPELWPEALSVARETKDNYLRSYTLRNLAEHLPTELLPEALNMTREIKDGSSRSSALIKLAKYFPELWPEALSVTREIKDESSRSSALIELAEYFPELWPEALSVTREIKDKFSRSYVLIELADEHLPAELWPEALNMTREIKDESPRSSALIKLAKHLSELWPEALSVTREIKDEYLRSSALAELAEHLPAELWPEALSMTREIKGESPRSSALSDLTEYLPAELWSEALSMTREIKDKSSRSSALIKLAKHLPELWPEVLSVAREIKDEYLHSFALIKLAKHFPELWPEALSVTREIKDEYLRSSALSDLAEHLPTELWPEVLSMTQEIKDESSRSSALNALAKHLPTELLQEALESIWSLSENYFRATALQGFLSRLEKLSIPFL